jgi:hypothetical protein
LNKIGIFVLFTAGAFAQGQVGGIGGMGGGPGILSRGAGDLGKRGAAPVTFRYFLEASGTYDTGLTPFAVTETGDLREVRGLFGLQGTVGAYGNHSWRRSALGVDYQGNYRHYTENSFLDGSDQALGIGYSHMVSRRVVLELRGVAGTTSRGVGGYQTYLPTEALNLPNTLLFDNRADFYEVSMGAVWQKNARTAFMMSGSGYTVRRHASALIGVNGYSFQGGASRRVSRRRTVFGGYQFFHYDYPRAFGESDIHFAQLGFGQQIGRRWELRLYGGAFRAEVQGLQRVALDPAVAALLGQGTAIQAFYRVNIYGGYGASLAGRFRRVQLDVGYDTAPSPGNGIYLTSRTGNVRGNISLTGLQKFHITLTGGQSTVKSLGQDIPPYSVEWVALGTSYALTRSLHFTAHAHVRHQEISQGAFRRFSESFSFGLAFSPGEVPLALW